MVPTLLSDGLYLYITHNLGSECKRLMTSDGVLGGRPSGNPGPLKCVTRRTSPCSGHVRSNFEGREPLNLFLIAQIAQPLPVINIAGIPSAAGCRAYRWSVPC